MGEERTNPSESGSQDSASQAHVRRKLIRGGLAAGPAVLALRGQSALAATGCRSPSAIASGNLSPGRTPPPCGTGFSPGYWKVCQHLGQWSGALTAPTFPPGTCESGMPSANPVTPGALFGAILPFANSGSLGLISAWNILAYPTRVDKSLEAFSMVQVQLARHLIATYLNFKTVANFPVTEAQMRAMWEQGSSGSYCPAGTGCTTPWTAQQVVCYLRNYTMDQTSVAADPVGWVC